MSAIACRIRNRRKALGLSQREFAALVGLRSQGLASDIEAGRKLPSIRTALKCAAVLDSGLPELFPRLQREISSEVATSARQLERALQKKNPSQSVAEQLAIVSKRLTQTT
jgi:transcriptional regulator with XRE-family HTH domain